MAGDRFPVTFTYEGKRYDGILEHQHGTGRAHVWHLTVRDKYAGELQWIDKKWKFTPTEKAPAMSELADHFGQVILRNPTLETRTFNWPRLMARAEEQLPDINTFNGITFTVPVEMTYDVLGQPDLSGSPKIEIFNVRFRKIERDEKLIWDFDGIIDD